jgi:hypothetical protein
VAVMTSGLGGVRLGVLRFEMTMTAFGVFGRFQITNFYGFLSCCHSISFSVSG